MGFGKLAQPLRAALTGTTVSPGLFEVMRVLGRDEVLARLEDAAKAAMPHCNRRIAGGRRRRLDSTAPQPATGVEAAATSEGGKRMSGHDASTTTIWRPDGKPVEAPGPQGHAGARCHRHPQALRRHRHVHLRSRLHLDRRLHLENHLHRRRRGRPAASRLYRSRIWRRTSDYLEVCYLILNGELPNQAERNKFVHDITYHTMVHDQIQFCSAASAATPIRWR